MIEIRPATIHDAELIADISRETFYETYVAYNTKADMDKFMSEQFSKEKLIAQVGVEGNLFLLAYENEALAGYVFLRDERHPQIPEENAVEICRFYARSSFIGRGVGKAMMQAAVAHALAANKTFIWLIVWQQNERALQFYTSFGFEIFAEQDFILGDDVQRDWGMRLKISS
ncbi:MAG: GNAT family N-acetyltransferase [Bacteroidota bacterium]